MLAQILLPSNKQQQEHHQRGQENVRFNAMLMSEISFQLDIQSIFPSKQFQQFQKKLLNCYISLTLQKVPPGPVH